MRIFFVLFLLFPLAELYVLIKVGSSIGALATILLLVLSGIAGVLLLRLAGFATAWRARERLARVGNAKYDNSRTAEVLIDALTRRAWVRRRAMRRRRRRSSIGLGMLDDRERRGSFSFGSSHGSSLTRFLQDKIYILQYTHMAHGLSTHSRLTGGTEPTSRKVRGEPK